MPDQDPSSREVVGGQLMEEPHYGHPKFHEFCRSLSDLHNKKNYDYAKGGRPLGNFERTAAIKQLYPGLDWTTREGTALDYMLKQLDAYMWLKCQGHATRTGEGPLPRLTDVGVYTGIIYAMEQENLANPDSSTSPTSKKRTPWQPHG